MRSLVRTTVADHPKAVLRERIAPVLVGVQVRFREMIIDRILVFEAMKNAIEANRQPAQALGKIADMAHKIAGVAATLGYPYAGQLAAEVEQLVRDGDATARSTHQTWSCVRPSLEALMDELESLLDE
jgi:HPt (histidine-containing phosphotransfer) domain-containing protein